jgi:hypothetical protein
MQDLLAQFENESNLLLGEIESLTKKVMQMRTDWELQLMLEIKTSPYRLQIAEMYLCKAEILAKMQKSCKYNKKNSKDEFKVVLSWLFTMFLASLAIPNRYTKKELSVAITTDSFRPHVIVAFSALVEDSNQWPASLVKIAFKNFINQLDK